jgi:hypothetical protein
MTLARALMRRTDKGKHYGIVTAKFVAVLEALLWGFHNAASGRCYPSYERIADRAGCTRTTVYTAIRALEAVGILSWCNRLVRVREACADLFGRQGTRWRVVRTSNAYVFCDPQTTSPASKFKLQTRTADQSSNLLPALWKTVPPPLAERCRTAPTRPQPDDNGLYRALARLGAAVKAARG